MLLIVSVAATFQHKTQECWKDGKLEETIDIDRMKNKAVA